MTKRYSVLQKKLQEFESHLFHLFSVPSHETFDQPDLTDLGNNLAFLKNLLAAEISTSPSKPHHLLHISQRISVLESAIRDWESTEAIAVDDFGGSSCSCTESCLNDDGEAFYEQNMDDETGLVELSGTLGENEASVERNSVMEEDKALVEWRDHSKEERVEEEKIRVFEGEGGRRRRRRRFYGAMAIGVAFGMVFMSFTMVLMGFLGDMQNGNFVTPT